MDDAATAPDCRWDGSGYATYYQARFLRPVAECVAAPQDRFRGVAHHMEPGSKRQQGISQPVFDGPVPLRPQHRSDRRTTHRKSFLFGGKFRVLLNKVTERHGDIMEEPGLVIGQASGRGYGLQRYF